MLSEADVTARHPLRRVFPSRALELESFSFSALLQPHVVGQAGTRDGCRSIHGLVSYLFTREDISQMPTEILSAGPDHNCQRRQRGQG